MRRNRLPILILAGCYVLFFAVTVLSFGSLPERVASHFDAAGRANGWMSRSDMVEANLAFGVLLPAFIVGVTACTRWMPARFVNLPHREYWLAPERRKETSAVVFNYGLWMACLTILFVTGLHLLMVQANTVLKGKGLSPDGMALLLVFYVGGLLIWCLLLLRRFIHPPTA